MHIPGINLFHGEENDHIMYADSSSGTGDPENTLLSVATLDAYQFD